MKRILSLGGWLGCCLVVASADVVRIPGKIEQRVELPGEFACRVSFDLANRPEIRTAVAQISVPLQFSAAGYPSLRLFVLERAGAERFVAAVTPNTGHPAAVFNITDYFNDSALVGRVVFVVKSVPGPPNSIHLTPGQDVALTVNTEAMPRYGIGEMLAPIWLGRRMVNEIVLPVSSEGGRAEGRLLFSPTGKPVVRNYSLDKTYASGVDYVIEGNVLRLTANSTIPFLTEKQLYPDSAEGSLPTTKTWDGKFIVSGEGFFNERQLAITYDHSETWRGPVPSAGEGKLRQTKEKLRLGRPLKVVLLGDSISTGASASGRAGKPPFVPGWGDLLMQGLRNAYRSPITFVNVSRGGGNAGWGRKLAPYAVVPEKPDLCIIAFGINDGNSTPTKTYLDNMQAIIELVIGERPDAEFILVASMLRNERWRPLSPMNTYLSALKTLESDRIAVADVWSMSEHLLKTKRYCDIGSLNHPNDFMVRVYAQTVAALLLTE